MFFLMAFVICPKGEGGSPKTTPYDFGLPSVLMKVITPPDNAATVEGVALGRSLFYDSILSGNRKQSCAGCHRQEYAFTDGRDISVGTLGKKARRNSMSLVNLGWQDRFFWDGRAATLEDLIHFPIMDSLEMDADTVAILRHLNSDRSYKERFAKAFGQDTITMTLVSRSISQFLRSIVSYNAPFDLVFRDYFSNGGSVDVDDKGLLANGLLPDHADSYMHDSSVAKRIKDISPDARVLNVFSVCLKCHYNSLQQFSGRKDTMPTLRPGQGVLYANNGLEVSGGDIGRYQITGRDADKYIFKVPTFRNLIYSGPYMHDGRFKTLEQVVDHYNTGIQPNPNLDTLLIERGTNKPVRFNLTDEEKKQLVGLLKMFTDTVLLSDRRYADPMSK